jgi:16S rRNA (guanine(966)-N(2))-methyltransferase RsmD
VSLRVISGSARGRRLKSVAGDTTRPITDRAKEALFNILAGDVVASSWWDVFAGTGAVGIEALSRGASLVRFSDLHRAPIETVKSNLEHCGLSARAEVRRGDAFAMLGARPDRQFEFIYIAPPQFKDMWSRALLALDDNPGWLTVTGWSIVQIAPKEYRSLELNNLQAVDQRKYGSTLLVFYEWKES